MYDRDKMLFQHEMESKLNSLKFQRERILNTPHKELWEKKISPIHDVDFYVILLRRLFRQIESEATYDSRVANLKGKNIDLVKKIKIRDDFEHGIDLENMSPVDVANLPSGTISAPVGANIKIATSLMNDEIVSGDLKWSLNKDHQLFIQLIIEFSNLYPFNDERTRVYNKRMKLYRFSPIKNKEQLLEAMKYTHFACFELCKKALGDYLPIAGNMGIFCHYESEYTFLTKLREELTEKSDNFNQKYFRLHEPITIPANGNVPETTYTYLYIRRPDQYRAQVGDLDFVLDDEKYKELKNSLPKGKEINGAKIFDRPDLDMIELSDPDIDALSYISTRAMVEKVRVRTN
ncbi:hypothetical protein A3G98_00270 [Candidatus Nomurabacteria bacterium RIFCSPLOWO2_12_FULL_37_8]|uniref:Uncharacterized protein n=1 Tax=Candidatus Nomurabacteria bacterium RIFCSPLOWO2_12_FULL_37_8 TaxID=1801793 RepID=A0A1F6Y559_9BACT|nr:MAG: hypothetical protein A3G98_00270 [Candidatus Nomurabacteria bacterium RIFCSPLOWO2_12_FULL_37_8]